MSEQRPSLDPKAYAAFIGQIELRAIWLVEAQVKNAHGPDAPEEGAFHIEETAHWEPRPTGFRALHGYRVRLEAGDDSPLDIALIFGVDFISNEPMTEEIFAVFQRANLPVNTWPYLREYVSSTLGRMGWQPFTLPALKRGTPRRQREIEPETGEARPKRTRRTPKKSEYAE